MTTNTVPTSTALAPVHDDGEITGLLRLAVEHNLDVDKLERLVALKRDTMREAAARAYAVALCDFQRRCPKIRRTSSAEVKTRDGDTYSYTYAELDQIWDQIAPLLGELGLCVTYDSQVLEGKALVCKCVVRHVGGHAETGSFTGPAVSGSPGMSDIQKHASALTYAKRQALVQVLGLTMTDVDSDGAERPHQPAGLVTEEQAANLKAMLEELDATGAEEKRFLKWMRVDRLSEIPAAQYSRAVGAIEGKRKDAGR